MASEKDKLRRTRKAVDMAAHTSNGYYYRVNTDGEAAIYCKRGDTYHGNPELKKAVREIMRHGRETKIFIWQWYLKPIL